MGCSNIKTKLLFSDWGSTLDRFNKMFYDIDKEKERFLFNFKVHFGKISKFHSKNK